MAQRHVLFEIVEIQVRKRVDLAVMFEQAVLSEPRLAMWRSAERKIMYGMARLLGSTRGREQRQGRDR